MPLPKSPGLKYVYPLQVSANKRYFVDQHHQPFFWLGDTQWELFRSFTLKDAAAIIRDRKNKGFTVVQVMLFGVGDGLQKNIHGQPPWKDKNSLTPNEAYFRQVDAILQIAREHGIIISLTLFTSVTAAISLWRRRAAGPGGSRPGITMCPTSSGPPPLKPMNRLPPFCGKWPPVCTPATTAAT